MKLFASHISGRFRFYRIVFIPFIVGAFEQNLFDARSCSLFPFSHLRDSGLRNVHATKIVTCLAQQPVHRARRRSGFRSRNTKATVDSRNRCMHFSSSCTLCADVLARAYRDRACLCAYQTYFERRLEPMRAYVYLYLYSVSAHILFA